MTYRFKTGESIRIGHMVSNVVDLNDATVTFGFINLDTGEVIVKTPTINGNILDVTLDSSDTMIAGAYKYEFWVIIDQMADCVQEGYIVLNESKMKEMI